jgi:hypothetical protein
MAEQRGRRGAKAKLLTHGHSKAQNCGVRKHVPALRFSLPVSRLLRQCHSQLAQQPRKE